MKILLSFFLLFFCLTTVTAQIKYYNSIEKSNDTLADFHYFKILDKSIQEKLDSFLLYIKSKTEFKKNEWYIEVALFKRSSGRVTADISINDDYAYYRIVTSKKNDFGNIFAFSFYKSKLIIFTSSYSRYRIKEEFMPLLHDLIYPELSAEVQKEIDKNGDEFQIQFDGGLVKRYYLE